MDDFHARNFMRGYNTALTKLDDPDCLRAVSVLAGDLWYKAKQTLQRLVDTLRGSLTTTGSGMTLRKRT